MQSIALFACNIAGERWEMAAITHNEGLDLFYGSRNRADMVSWFAKVVHRCVELLSVEDLLDGAPARFTKEDGEVVTR